MHYFLVKLVREVAETPSQSMTVLVRTDLCQRNPSFHLQMAEIDRKISVRLGKFDDFRIISINRVDFDEII